MYLSFVRDYNYIKSSKYRTNPSRVLEGSSNEHTVVCVDYISEVLADASVKNSKKKKSEVVKCTLRKKHENAVSCISTRTSCEMNVTAE